jgi:energy-coupling factor transport system substrate-specific component
MIFLAANLAGLIAFALPFLVAGPGHQQEAGARFSDAPWLLALFVPLLIAAAIVEAGRGHLGTKTIALLGVLAALAALMRIPISFGGANLIFFLPIVGGFVFGVRFGFMLGALAMAASAAITGGIGPWLPFQMWGAGWVGAGAGLISPLANRRDSIPVLIVLAVYGYLAGLFFGALINLYFWPVASLPTSIGWSPDLTLRETLQHYRAFYLLTSLPYDAMRGLGNAVVLLVIGKPVIELLRRHKRRFFFESTQEPQALGLEPAALVASRQ